MIKKIVCTFILIIMPIWNSCAALQTNNIQKQLNNYVNYVKTQKEKEFGYPANQNIQLTQFYKWYTGNKLYSAMVNNAGDPFDSPKSYMNALDIERKVIEYFGSLYGFEKDNLWGIVTNSGTDGNNHGIYFGVNYLEKKTHKKPVMYVSEDAHYSNMRLADLQNLDMVVVPADEHGRMIPEELEKSLIKNRPALIVYAMGTTFKGGIDDQEALNKVLKKYPNIEVYRHIDAALFGGYLPYTKYKDIVNRKVQSYDSIAISGHKFYGLDEPAGIFLTTKEVKEAQNSYNIAYINGSMPMINCSRSAVAPLKFLWIINNVGTKRFVKQSNDILENAAWLKNELDKLNWPAWLEPMSNTVYFKIPPQSVISKYHLAQEYDKQLGGELCHIVVMQHMTKKHLQNFLNDLTRAK